MKLFCLLFTLLSFFFASYPLQAQWDSLVIPGQDAIVKTFVSGGKLFTVASAGGLYRSNDNGRFWVKQNTPGLSGPLTGGSVAQWEVRHYGSHIYLKNFDFVENDLRLYESHDAGDSWQEIVGADSVMYNKQDWLATQAGLLVILDHKIYRRPYNSSDWQLIAWPYNAGGYLASDGDEVWLTSGIYHNGVYRSADGGQNWQPVTTIAEAYHIIVRSDTVIVNNPDGVFRSVDDGQTWELMFNDGISSHVFLPGANGFYLLKRLDGSYPSDTLWYSTDGFKTRSLVHTAPGFGAGLGIMDIFSSNGVDFLGTTDILLRREQGTTGWKIASFGIPNLFPLNVSLQFTTDSLLLVQPNINYNNKLISKDAGKNWEICLQRPSIGSVVKKGDWYYVLSVDTYRTQGDFNHLEKVSVNQLFGPTELGVIDTTLIAWSFNNLTPHLYFSTDNGMHWQNPFPQLSTLKGLALVKKRLYSYDPAKHEAFYSTDYGASWISMGRLGVFPGQYLVRADEVNGTLFLATNKAVYTSGDGGQNWSETPLPVGYNPYRGATQDGIFYQDWEHLYYSPDNGHSILDVTPPGVTLNTLNYTASATFGNTLYTVAGNHLWFRDEFDAGIRKASGIVYKDENNNGIFDSGEAPFPRAVVALQGAGSAVTADDAGKFTLFFNQNDILAAKTPSGVCNVSPLSYPVVDSDSTFYFGIYCSADQTDIGLQIVPFTTFRPGFPTQAAVVMYNRGTTVQSGSFHVQYDQNILQYQQATPAPSGTQAGTLQWNFSNLMPFETRNFVITYTTSQSAVLGTVTNIEALYNPAVPDDIDTGDNHIKLPVVIVGAFDPNDKSVSPEIYTTSHLAANEPLHYTIRFQNTGTFPATFVVLRDTLSSGLDLSTLRITGASHPFRWRLETPRLLEFRFDDIDLPYSAADEPGSHGFVQYEVQPRANMQVGDSISNRAGIYFDFNVPVITNTVFTVLEMPTSTVGVAVRRTALLVAPNPGSGVIRIEAPEMQVTENAWIRIYNFAGQEMENRRVKEKAVTVDTGAWPKGVYQIIWDNGGKMMSARLVVE